jgi:hypothetical protein
MNLASQLEPAGLVSCYRVVKARGDRGRAGSVLKA